jgi:hypothetical protein
MTIEKVIICVVISIPSSHKIMSCDELTSEMTIEVNIAKKSVAQNTKSLRF